MLQNTLARARQARKNEGGFTLIELLIVIVILGVLAGIVVFSVRGIQDRGDTAACKANVATVETAVEAYYAKHGSYPTKADDLTGVTDPKDEFVKAPFPAGIVTTWDTTGAAAPTIKAVSAC
jgi:type II secretion system protein G